LGSICGWLDRKAGSRPLVVSCSLGEARGGRNGSRILERQIDTRFPETARGRVFCVAAGNEALQRAHAQTSFAGPQAAGRIGWWSARSRVVTLYFDMRDAGQLEVRPDGATEVRTQSYIHPLSGQVVIELSCGAGRGAVMLTNREAKRTTCHA